MLLRVLKTLLRASPWLLGLILTMYLIVIHGPRLAVDGHAPLAGAGVRALLCAVLAALVLGVVWFRRRGNKPDEGQPASPHVILDESSERELALRERLGAWRRRTGGQLPGFLLIGPAGVDKGPLLGLPANAEEDLRCSSVGGFALFDIGASLINQRQPQEARLWRRLLDDLDPSSGLQLRGLILVLSAARLHSAAPQELDQIALTLRARLEELANRFGKGLTVQLIVIASNCPVTPSLWRGWRRTAESLAWSSRRPALTGNCSTALSSVWARWSRASTAPSLNACSASRMFRCVPVCSASCRCGAGLPAPCKVC